MNAPQAAATIGVVVLTQGTRPDELRRGLDSLLRQRGVSVNIVVVGNGWEPTGLPEGVRALALPANRGIPAGRNAGVPEVSGEFLFFLDDDAWLPDDDVLARGVALLRAQPSIGMIQPRILDPADPGHPGRWVPRMRKGDPAHSSNIFSVVELAVLLRRSVFDATPSGWPAPFWYAHEGIELAWRVWDTGHRVWYAGDLHAAHPVFDPRRHDDYYVKNARNRVWLARRNLPWPFRGLYVASWTLVQLIRARHDVAGLRPWWAGWRTGWREDPWAPGEPRRLIGWGTIARMARYGRPPVV